MKQPEYKIGIDLGGSHIAIGVVDNKNYIVEKVERRLLVQDKKDIKTSIESYILQKYIDVTEKYEIKELGIAVPGTDKRNNNSKICKFRC